MVLAAVHVTRSSLIVGMPVLIVAIVMWPVEVLVVLLRVVAMSLHTAVTSLPLKFMAIFLKGVHVCRMLLSACSLWKWKL